MKYLPSLIALILITIQLNGQSYQFFRLSEPPVNSLYFSSVEFGDSGMMVHFNLDNPLEGSMLAITDRTFRIQKAKRLVSQESGNHLFITDLVNFNDSSYLGILRSHGYYSKAGYVVIDSNLTIKKSKVYNGIGLTGMYGDNNDYVVTGNDIYFLEYASLFAPSDIVLHKCGLDSTLKWQLHLDINNHFDPNVFTDIYEMSDGNILMKINDELLVKIDSETGDILYSREMENYHVKQCLTVNSKIYVFMDSDLDKEDHWISVAILDQELNKIKNAQIYVEDNVLLLDKYNTSNWSEFNATDSLFHFKFASVDSSNQYIAAFDFRRDSFVGVYQVPFNMYYVDHNYSDFYFAGLGGFGRIIKEEGLDCPARSVTWIQKDRPDFKLKPVTMNHFVIDTSSESMKSSLYLKDISFEQRNFCDPQASFQFIKDTICEGDRIEVVDSSIFEWGQSVWRLVNQNGHILAQKSGKSAVYFETDDMKEGTYTIVHRLDFHSRLNTASKSFVVTHIPQASIAGTNSICGDDTTELTFTVAEEADLDSFVWFSNQSILQHQGTDITVDSPGRYNVAYHGNHCSDTIQHELQAGPTVQQVQIEGEASGCEEDGVGLSVSPETNIEGPVQYEWSTGEEGQSIHVHQSGTYFVEAHQKCGTSRDSINVELQDCTRNHYIPNVFTPDGDDVNDVWHPMPREGWTFYIEIFNRRGSRVYECRGTDCAWDGIFEGEPVLPGVYVYRIEAIHEDGTEREYSGDVTLVR